MEWILFLLFLGFIYLVGKSIDTTHYKQIAERESAYLQFPVTTTRHLPEDVLVTEARLVTGNVVISGDYFRFILASLINFFGGRVVGYESLIDRARREAILRMKDEARSAGASMIVNMRFEMSKLDGGVKSKGTGMFELLAYGTALTTKPA